MTQAGFDSQRRRLIKLLGAAAATIGGVAGHAEAAPAFAASPFQLGVASGSPAADGFVLWTRLIGDGASGASVPVQWEVRDGGGAGAVVASGTANALAALGYAVHVEVNGLAAGRQYGYRFKAGGFESAPALARTLPDAQQAVAGARLRLAYASCQRWEDGQYAAYRHMLAEKIDFVVFVGDYIYEGKSRDAGEAVRVHPLKRIRDLDDYRRRYALYKSDPALQAMHAACPWLVTWDDHEVENNYSGALSTRGTANFERLRMAAYQAFYEHMPLRASTMIDGLRGLQRGAELRIYQHYDFGKLARLYLLDDRQYRARPPCGDKPKEALAAVCGGAEPDRSMFGAAQEAWLADAMGEGAARGARWNLLVQQTRLTPANYRYGPGVKAADDHWDAYPQARRRLLDAIRSKRPANPLILGGDVHLNWVANVHLDPYDVRSPLIASEFCGTSITSRNEGSQKKAEKHQDDNPHCLLVNKAKRGYGVLELSAEQAVVRLRVLDDVARLDSGIATLASFKVLNGQPGPKQLS
ncbi:MAG: alkaline phosphatase [Massilia sp.]|nr:alkaline phosphatase [Massilia sp.]